MLAVPDSFLALGAFAVAVVMVVLVVMAYSTGRGGRKDHSVSPPSEGQQEYRKPHA